jgi:tetratricopeptide (TPR) repeat protein
MIGKRDESMKFLLLFALFTTVVSAKELIVTSTPNKAEVRILPLSGASDNRKAGETPFSIPIAEAASAYANGSDIFILEVHKEGYETYRVIIPEFIKASINLDVVLNQKNDLETIKKVDKGMTILFEAQRMIRSKNYEGALKKIDEAEAVMPKLSVTKELQAATYYMQNDYKKALDHYQQAFAANTENLDAYKMIVYLEKAMGVKKIGREPAEGKK